MLTDANLPKDAVPSKGRTVVSVGLVVLQQRRPIARAYRQVDLLDHGIVKKLVSLCLGHGYRSQVKHAYQKEEPE